MTAAEEPRPWLEDAVLLFALAVLLVFRPVGAMTMPLASGIVLALTWGYATLHVPSRVEIRADGISFSRYGRIHAFTWRDVERVRLRRFLVKDRVFVRVSPSPPWRGRYWLRDSLSGYDALVKELEGIARRIPS
jgi:hypothetical protein